MARIKESKENQLQVIPMKPQSELPESLSVLNLDFNSEKGMREILRKMKEFALNNYLVIVKIESLKSYTHLGYSSLQEFIESELKGIISYRNAIGFIEYVKQQTEEEELDDETISKLLGIYRDEKNKSSKEKDKRKENALKTALDTTRELLSQRDLEIENLRKQLDDISRTKGIDPKLFVLVKSETELREKLESVRKTCVSEINSLRGLDQELLQSVGYTELQLCLAAIKGTLEEVTRLYSQYFVTLDIVSKLEDV